MKTKTKHINVFNFCLLMSIFVQYTNFCYFIPQNYIIKTRICVFVFVQINLISYINFEMGENILYAVKDDPKIFRASTKYILEHLKVYLTI